MIGCLNWASKHAAQTLSSIKTDEEKQEQQKSSIWSRASRFTGM